MSWDAEINKKRQKVLQENKKNGMLTSPVDPEWEIFDPNPDIYSLFHSFNLKFFWNTLGSVEVKWSPRMTLCAGICTYKGIRGCVVSLSSPLLKLRPRSDLVNTLLHEMIHAYLFLTRNNRDRDGHGPEFHKHMHRINNEAGTSISVYHTFHDEVRFYRAHWWRCDGPCRKRPPFYGLVKRSMNRAPGPNDLWHNEHQLTCGGNFTKIKEPEGYGEKKTKASNVNQSKGQTRLFAVPNTPKPTERDPPSGINRIYGFSDYDTAGGFSSLKSNNGGTLIQKPTTSKRKIDDSKPSSSLLPFSGVGHVLSKTPSLDLTNCEGTFPCPLCNKFFKASLISNHVDSCLDIIASLVICSNCDEFFEQSKISSHEAQCDKKKCPVCDLKMDKKEIELHLSSCGVLEDIFSDETIACPICDVQLKRGELDNHLDLCLDSSPPKTKKPEKCVPCPICNVEISIEKVNKHLDICVKS